MVANAPADAGLEPRRHYIVILDELWRALRAGRGMVDRVDALTRLGRQRGVGLAMISHTMSDLHALPTEEERMKARGFVERAGMIVARGLPSAEMSMLTAAIPLSKAEQDLLISWQDPPAWDSSTGREAEPPRPRQVPDQSRRASGYTFEGAAHGDGGGGERHQPHVACDRNHPAGRPRASPAGDGRA